MGESVNARPTTGRFLHFYDSSLDDHANNGAGKGPYCAIVLGHVDSAEISLLNLRVLGFGIPDRDEGTVSSFEEIQALYGDPEPGKTYRYWVWPPRA